MMLTFLACCSLLCFPVDLPQKGATPFRLGLLWEKRGRCPVQVGVLMLQLLLLLLLNVAAVVPPLLLLVFVAAAADAAVARSRLLLLQGRWTYRWLIITYYYRLSK